jgi:thiol:disulfide interchange protein DsbD
MPPLRRPTVTTRLLTLLLALSAALPFATAGGDPLGAPAPLGDQQLVVADEFLPVEQAYRLDTALLDDTLVLRWEIADGYYLYRHQFRFVADPGGELTAALPEGQHKVDEYFGEIEAYYGEVEATLTGLPAQPLSLAVTSQGCADAGLCYPPQTHYLRVDRAAGVVTPMAAPPAPPAPAGATSAAPQPTEWRLGQWLLMLLAAAAGGVVLNLMPCVFPVLSLKVLGFANSRNHHPGLHALSYGAGVMLSFLLIAALLLALRGAGSAVGWGFQLQQPWFVGAMTYLFFALGLSLSGFWVLGGSWMGAGGTLASSRGYGGSFFTGVLACLVASPCTAPFMGGALGYAVTQPAPVALAVFAALGFGMALPVILLTLSPGLLKRLPKPGAWMEYLKQALAFPLYATAIWLAWVVGRQSGATAMALLLGGVLLVTLALWLWRFGTVARIAAAISFALALALLANPILNSAPSRIGGTTAETAADWQPYDAGQLAALRAAGRPVFINATADWCITCLANERVTLSSERVRSAFRDRDITYMKADWTHYDAAITALLAEFGRSGVPLYVFYPATGKPRLLPQLLTPDLVLKALDES